MNQKSIGIGLILIATALIYCYGLDQRHAGEADALGRTAVAHAAERHVSADSIAKAVRRRDDSAKRAVDSVARATAATIAQVRHGTDAAVLAANTARAIAERLLADTGATVTELRGALRQSTTALAAVTDSLGAERRATSRALAQRDSAHEAREAQLRLGFTATRTADSSAFAALTAGLRQSIDAANRAGVQRGRAQVAGVVVAAVVVKLAVSAFKQ